MAISRTKRQLSTNTAGLRQSKPYTRPPVNETSSNVPESGYFPLQPTQYPPGTPITAIRSKKIYSDLVDERAFLLNVKEYWVEKLKDLKEDHKYLSKMKNVSKNQVIGVPPLFTREEDEPLELRHPPLPSAATTEDGQSVDTNDKSTTVDTPSEQFSLLGDNIELKNFNQLEQLEVLFKNRFSDEEDNGEDDEDEEDEAKTREALSLLLQEFGDM